MKDQIDQLTRRGVAAGRLDSTLTGDEVRALMDGLRKGTLRLLYVAPERFNNERFREAISRDSGVALRGRRGALHLRVGAQFPPRLPEAGRLRQALRRRAHPGPHRHRHAAGARRHLPRLRHRARLRRPHRLPPREPDPPLHPHPPRRRATPCSSNVSPRALPAPPSSTSPCRKRPRTWPPPCCAPGCRPAPTTPAWRTTSGPACRTGSWNRRTRWSSPPSPSAWGSTRRTSAR